MNKHHIMAKFWWILAARGALGILLGLAAIGWIFALGGNDSDLFGTSLFAKWATLVAALVLLLGLYAFLDGFFALVLGAQDYGNGQRWWVLIAEGALSVVLGVMTWIKPEITVLVLLYAIAAWAVATGVLEIAQADSFNEYKDRRKPLFFAGICSVLFGLSIFVFNPGGIILVGLMGAYAFTSGIPLLVMALRLRSFARASRR